MIPTSRLFDVAAAEQTLPLVRLVARDLAASHRRLASTVQDYSIARALVDDSEAPYSPALRQLARRMLVALLERQLYRRELREIGCLPGEEAVGEVEFPSLYGGPGRTLCWRIGDQGVRHWHAAGQTHGQRTPIPPS